MAARKPLLTLLTVTALLWLAACGRTGVGETPPERGDRPVARVEGKTIWASDVKREALAQGLIREGEPLEVSSELFHQVMDEVVDQKLLAAEALKRKLDKDPLAQRRLAMTRERILGDMLVERVVSDAVSDAAIRGLYEEQVKLAKRTEEIRARQIVVATLPEAEALKRQLTAGAAFESLAMQRSLDPATRFNGGDMGYFTADVMPDAYGAVLKTAGKGALVGPFPVEGGYALVRIEDRREEAPITLEAARPQIVRFLTYDQIRDLLEKLRGKARIEFLLTGSDDMARPVPPADAKAPLVIQPAPQTAPQKAPAQKAPPAKAVQP
jgi:peptidyl-prolyl cis-trans isomerase C